MQFKYKQIYLIYTKYEMKIYMNEKERLEKINKINDEFNKINKKLKDSTDTVIIKGMYVKDELEDKIESVKNNLNTVKKNLEEKHGDDKSLFAKHLNKIQESINEAKSKLEDKKEARNKEKLEKYIDGRLEYTSDCIAIALIAIDEAKLSFLEALEAQVEYDGL
jgi:DNA repair exonuclease SbcCD ATPase subunit